MVEEADSEILLDADREPFRRDEFDHLVALLRRSGETFMRIYSDSVLKDWVDESKIRRTFRGENSKTIREVFDHVN